jgi:hypothetical protein
MGNEEEEEEEEGGGLIILVEKSVGISERGEGK